MTEFLEAPDYDFIPPGDKAFTYAFDAEMNRLGYDFGGKIGPGYCWGRYMLIYTKSGVKSKQVYARIYVREQGVVLRLYLNAIDQHRVYIENTPAYLKEVFTGPQGICQHCEDKPKDQCIFRKTYTLDGVFIEKCSGVVFEFHQPSTDKLADYIGLFNEFYPARKR